MFDPTKTIFSLAPDILLENFGDTTLVLRGAGHKVFELNPTAHLILSKTDGQRTAAAVALEVQQAFGMSEAGALRETVALYDDLLARYLVRITGGIAMSSIEFGTKLFSRNPDVLLREANPDGALLFNPDTNQVKVLNATGLFIWQQCDGSLNVSEMAEAVAAIFAGGTKDEIAQDVQEFLQTMMESGFIGFSEPVES